MKRFLASFLAVAFALPGQKIETKTPARDRVVRVQTALNLKPIFSTRGATISCTRPA